MLTNFCLDAESSDSLFRVEVRTDAPSNLEKSRTLEETDGNAGEADGNAGEADGNAGEDVASF